MIPSWIVFLFVLLFIMLLSKYELSIILIIGNIIFALVAQVNLVGSFLNVFLDPSIIFLEIAVSIIPLLGGIMEESGLMKELLEKLNVKKKTSLMLSPALFGLLPVAGGALMSAPIVDEIDREIKPNRKVAINVWFRHLLILIYPLSSALIFLSYLAGINLYLFVVYLLIPFLMMGLVGYIYYLRPLTLKEEQSQRDIKGAIKNLSPLLIAPLIDFIGRTFFAIPYNELYLVIGLMVSLFLALTLAKMPVSSLKNISKKMKLWRFPLLILAMFWFAEIFTLSGVPEDIAGLNLPFLLFLCLGFFLGFATGRIQVPVSILVPIYLINFATSAIILFDFLFLYCAIFFGYLLTPIHPCVAYSINYFDINYKQTIKELALPSFFCFGLLIGCYFVISLF